jgi:ABC-type transport system involved in multi-copper enzyme maturation permease subunit
MRHAFIIGMEYARQQKVMLVIFACWIVGLDLLLVAIHHGNDFSDLTAMYLQQSIYGVVFTTFMAASVLRTERNSRRVLAILSKGITRAQYLGGHVIGLALLAALYYVLATSLYVLIGFHFGFEARVGVMLAAGLVVSTLAGAFALFMSTWSHPLIAAGLTMTVLMAPVIALAHSDALVISPVAYYMHQMFSFEPARGWSSPIAFWMVAVLETAAAWLCAAVIFKRQDVAVPTE